MAAAKSVLLKHIIGLLFPDKGRVIVDGQVLNDLDEFGLNELRKKFGMLFQMAALFDSLTVWENVGFSLKQHTKMSDREIQKGRDREVGARRAQGRRGQDAGRNFPAG